VTKDLYDTYLVRGFKHLTTDNWTEPDEAGRAFVALDPATGECREPTADRWAQQFLAVELSPSVPDKIRDMWAIARGTLLYAWFFYPLYALGEDQLRRVADAAVLLRYEAADGPRTRAGNWPDLKSRLDWLIAQGIVAQGVERRWEAIRQLRNHGSHATFARLVMPVEALETLTCLAREIDALYGST
jgi:hypothetical protein